MRLIRDALIVTLLVAGADSPAQTCDFSRPPSSPEDNYVINEDGLTITELATGLTWMRCAIGQTWDGKTCQGKPSLFSWQASLKQEDHYRKQRFADLDNWRLPALPELASIVETNCTSPRINLALFPHTPASAFWTANMRKHSNQSFALDFASRGLLALDRNNKLPVRLVSGRH